METLNTNKFYQALINYLPQIAWAVFYILFGWLIAILLRKVFTHLGNAIEKLLSMLGVQPKQIFKKISIPSMLGATAYWLAIALFISLAIQALGIPELDYLSQRFAAFFPNLISAFASLIIGLIIIILAQRLIIKGLDHSGIRYSRQIARFISYILFIIVLLFAIDQLNLDMVLLNDLMIILLSILFSGFALSYGLSYINLIKKFWSANYLRQQLEIGQYIHVQEQCGTIIDISRVAIILQQDEKKIIIPADKIIQEIITIDTAKINE